MQSERAQQRGRWRFDLPAFKQHLAAGGAMDAREDLDEGRFAGAVLAEKRVESAGLQLQVDLAKRDRRAKSLGDVAQLQKRRRRLKRAGHRAARRARGNGLPNVGRSHLVPRGLLRAVSVQGHCWRSILTIDLASGLLLQFFGRKLRAQEPYIVGQVGLNEVLESVGGDDLRRRFRLSRRFCRSAR